MSALRGKAHRVLEGFDEQAPMKRPRPTLSLNFSYSTDSMASNYCKRNAPLLLFSGITKHTVTVLLLVISYFQ
jgi:hypothetical protein